MGLDALWLTEFFAGIADPRTRYALSGSWLRDGVTSIFLAWEFGMEVWANDLRILAENSIRRFSVSGSVDQITRCIRM